MSQREVYSAMPLDSSPGSAAIVPSPPVLDHELKRNLEKLKPDELAFFDAFRARLFAAMPEAAERGWALGYPFLVEIRFKGLSLATLILLSPPFRRRYLTVVPSFWRQLRREGLPIRRVWSSHQWPPVSWRGLRERDRTPEILDALIARLRDIALAHRVVIGPAGRDEESAALGAHLARFGTRRRTLLATLRTVIAGTNTNLVENIWFRPGMRRPELVYTRGDREVMRIRTTLFGRVHVIFTAAIPLRTLSRRLRVGLAGPGHIAFWSAGAVDKTELAALVSAAG